MSLSPCGIACETCKDYQSCGGCRVIRGKPPFVKEYGYEVCSLYDCAVNKKGYQKCAECPDLPCVIFHEFVDPSVDERLKILRAEV